MRTRTHVWIGLVVLVTLCVGAAAVFLLTFDLDRYRPVVISKLEEATGMSVQLGRLSLAWRGGLACRLEGLSLSPRGSAGELPQAASPILQLESASAVIRLMPLMRREIQVASVILTRPQAHLIRTATGAVQLEGVPAPSTSPGSSSHTPPALGAALLISSLQIEEGTVQITDLGSGQTSAPVTIKRIEATVRNISLTRPIHIQVQAAVCGSEPNVSFSAKLRLPQRDQPGVMEDAHLSVDLDRVDLAEAGRAVPALAAFRLRDQLRGRLEISVARLMLTPQGWTNLEGSFRLKDGHVAMTDMASPFDRVMVDATAGRGRMEIKEASARVAGGTISLNGRIEDLATQPHETITVRADRIGLEAIGPMPGPREPQLQGQLSFAFDGTATGLAWPQISRTLSGTGTLQLHDGKLANVNLVRDVLERLSMIPSLADRLEQRLPPSYRAKLEANETVFEPLDLAIVAANGVISANAVRVASETFELTGSATIALTGAMGSQLMLRIDPDLSAALIRSVNELQTLTDAQGRLEVPVSVEGSLPRVAVYPDLQYVARRVLVTKAEELIGNLLQRARQPHGEVPAQPSP